MLAVSADDLGPAGYPGLCLPAGRTGVSGCNKQRRVLESSDFKA